MSVLQKCLDANYGVWGKDALYVPPSGPPIPIRIIIDTQDDVSSFGQSRIRSDKTIFNVRSLQVVPQSGDIVVFPAINGKSYTIKTADPLDPERLEWQMECFEG